MARIFPDPTALAASREDRRPLQRLPGSGHLSLPGLSGGHRRVHGGAAGPQGPGRADPAPGPGAARPPRAGGLLAAPGIRDSTPGKMGFAGYFLVVADIINYARKQHIPVGPGRGSAAGSLVAYSLGITDLDPLAYGLIFERFLNPERMSPPDIDVDFCYERRDEIIRLCRQDLRLGKRRPDHHLRQHEDPPGDPGRGPGPGGALRRSGQDRQAGARAD